VAGYIVALEQLAEMVGDDTREGDHMHDTVVGVGQAQNTGQDARDGNNTEGGMAVLLQQDADAQRLVEDARKGMGRVDDDGCQDRFQLATPVAADKSQVLALQIGDIEQMDTLPRQGRQQLLVPAAVLGRYQLVGRARDGAELLVWGQAVGAGTDNAAFLDLQQTGDADLEELVKDAGDDAEKTHALE